MSNLDVVLTVPDDSPSRHRASSDGENERVSVRSDRKPRTNRHNLSDILGSPTNDSAGDDLVSPIRRPRLAFHRKGGRPSMTDDIKPPSHLVSAPAFSMSFDNTPTKDPFSIDDDESEFKPLTNTSNKAPTPTHASSGRSGSVMSEQPPPQAIKRKVSQQSVLDRLKVASAMVSQGILNQNEFQELKTRVMSDMFNGAVPKPDDHHQRHHHKTGHVTSSILQPALHRRPLTGSEELKARVATPSDPSKKLAEEWASITDALKPTASAGTTRSLTVEEIRDSWDVTRGGLVSRFFPTGKEMMPLAEFLAFLKRQEFGAVTATTVTPAIAKVGGQNSKLISSSQFDSVMSLLRTAVLSKSRDTNTDTPTASICFDFSDNGSCDVMDLRLPANRGFFFDRSDQDFTSENRCIAAVNPRPLDALLLAVRYRIHPVLTRAILVADRATPVFRTFEDDLGHQCMLSLPLVTVAQDRLFCSKITIGLLPSFTRAILLVQSQLHNYDPVHPHSLGAILDGATATQVLPSLKAAITGGESEKTKTRLGMSADMESVVKHLNGLQSSLFHRSFEKLVWDEFKGGRDNGFILISVIENILRGFEAAVAWLDAKLATARAVSLKAIKSLQREEIRIPALAIEALSRDIEKVLRTVSESRAVMAPLYAPYIASTAEGFGAVANSCNGITQVLAGMIKEPKKMFGK